MSRPAGFPAPNASPPHRRLLETPSRVLKRAFDIAVASLALLLLAVPMALIALMVRLGLGAPVLFRQQRAGRHGEPFVMYKFRTMRDAHDAAGQPLPDQQRLTRLGRWLRRLSLDELPELFNVLRGEMSLVGPRPLLLRYRDRYSPEQWRRHEVRPGITGWAQVNGRNAISWEDKFRLDVWYVDHRSLGLDLWILLLTFAKALWPQGVSAAGEATMPEFLGLQGDRRTAVAEQAICSGGEAAASTPTAAASNLPQPDVGVSAESRPPTSLHGA